MAFIDTGANVQAFGGVNPGAPSGGGNIPTTGGSAANSNSAKGSNGMGSSIAIKHWVYIIYLFIVGVLVLTGYLFNGKGKK